MHSLHAPVCIFINAYGQFKDEKKASIIGAAANLLFSIPLTITIGYIGALAGTVISQFVIWGFRSYYLILKGLKQQWKYFFKYWLTSAIYIALFILLLLGGKHTITYIPWNPSIINFVFSGLVIELEIIVVNFLLFLKNPDARTAIQTFLPIILRKFGKMSRSK